MTSATEFFTQASSAPPAHATDTAAPVGQQPSIELHHEEQDNGGTKWTRRARITAVHPEHGSLGRLDYLRNSRGTTLRVQETYVEPHGRRQGIATALMDELQRLHPGARIEHGDRTPAGKAWWKSYTDGKTVTKGRTMAAAQPGLGPEDYARRDGEDRFDQEKRIRYGLSVGHLTYQQANEQHGFRAGSREDPGSEDSLRRKDGPGGWQPLPHTLYHTTTDVAGVMEHGLKSGKELGQRNGHGLGGTPEWLSLTDRADHAHNMLNALHEYHDVLNGKTSMRDLQSAAERGEGAERPYDKPYTSTFGNDPHHAEATLNEHVIEPRMRTYEQARAQGMTPHPALHADLGVGNDGEHYGSGWLRPMDEKEKLNRRHEAYSTFSQARHWTGGGAPSILFLSNDRKAFAAKDPANFGVVKLTPHPGAQGFPMEGEHEWRTGTGDAVHVEGEPLRRTSSQPAPLPAAATRVVFLDDHGPTHTLADDELNPTPVPDNQQPYQHHHDWLPTGHFFGPGKPGLDPRLFDGDHMRPEIRHQILALIDNFWAPKYGHDWTTWARVYLAGSEASHFYGNGDLDTLIGVDYDTARHLSPALAHLTNSEIDTRLTDELREGLDDDHRMLISQGHETGPWESTIYVNPDSYDIRTIKPYAAYDITDDRWAVPPVQVPADFDAHHLPETDWDTVDALRQRVKDIAALPTGQREAEGAALFDRLHTERHDAFGPDGTGLYDPRDVSYKALDVAPGHPLAELVKWKHAHDGAGTEHHCLTGHPGLDAMTTHAVSTPDDPSSGYTAHQAAVYSAQNQMDRTHLTSTDQIVRPLDEVDPHIREALHGAGYPHADRIKIGYNNKLHKGRYYSYAKLPQRGAPSIHLGLTGLNAHSGLHEAAHILTHHQHGPVADVHGPEFVAAFRQLLHDNGHQDALATFDQHYQPPSDMHLGHIASAGGASVSNGDDIPSRLLNAHGYHVKADVGNYRNVEMVPTHEVARYASQETTGEHAREVGLRMAETGSMEPLILQYHPKTGEAYLGEGNHRLRAANRLQMEHVPVRVTRAAYGLGGPGVRTPKEHPAIAAGEHVPCDIRPSDLGLGRTVEQPPLTAAAFFRKTLGMPHEGLPQGTDNEGHPVELDPQDGWQHLDGSVSHDDTTTVSDHPVATVGAETSHGIMVAIVPPAHIAAQLVQNGGEPAEELHITIAYLGKTSDYSREELSWLPELVGSWAARQKPLQVRIGGAGTFHGGEEHVLWASVDIPGGAQLHTSLDAFLTGHGYRLPSEHGWNPHLTLAYVDQHFRFLPKLQPHAWPCDKVWVCIGGQWTPCVLGTGTPKA